MIRMTLAVFNSVLSCLMEEEIMRGIYNLVEKFEKKSIEILKDEGYLPNTEYTEKIMHRKELRWVERLEEWKK